MKRKFAPMILLLMIAASMTVSCAKTEPDDTHKETVERIAETVSCTEAPAQEIADAPAQTEPVLFSEDITFTYEFINDGDLVPYGVFIPSSAADDAPVPVIVWLHSMTERGATEAWFSTHSLPGVLNNWELHGFRAYVICPQLMGKLKDSSWNNAYAAECVMDILNDFSQKHNVDGDHIVIAGHSLGGTGVMYLAIAYPDYFSKAVVMSSLRLNNGDMKAIDIPILGCVENMQNQFHFMNSEFKELFGEDSVRYYESEHPDLARVAFTEDKDGDNCSDLVAWMFDGP